MIQKNKKREFFTRVILLIGFALSVCVPAMAGGKVLLVHSYHEGYSWVDAITASAKEELEGSVDELEVFYMDTKRKPSEEWKVKSGQMAKEKMADFKPDVVITSDDNAQEYFAKDYAGKDSPQFVFCGVNAEASKYGFPASNVTGILERPHFIESLTLLKAIDGNINTIAVIGDDSPTTNAMYDYMRTLEEKSPVKIVSFDQPSTFAQWQALIQQYQDSVDAIAIIIYHTVKETIGGDSIEPQEVISWTMANNKKPTVGVVDFAIEDGVLCGVVESPKEHGFEAAQIAKQILAGKKASDFPVKTAKKGSVMFNVKTAESLGIEIEIPGFVEPDKPTAEVPGVTDNEILLGTYTPLTGPSVVLSRTTEGMEAYFEHINSQGGVHGRKIVLQKVDDQYDPANTPSAIKQLVEDDKAFAIVGAIGTATGLAVLDYVVDNEVPFIFPSSRAQIWGKPVKKNVFGLAGTYEAAAFLMLQYAVEQLGQSNIALCYQNDSYGESGITGAMEYLDSVGLSPVATVPYDKPETDFSWHAEQLRAANPDAVLLWTLPSATEGLKQEFEKLGFAPTILVSEPGNALSSKWEGAIVEQLFSRPKDDPLLIQQQSILQKFLGDKPITSRHERGYGTAEVFVEALQRAGRDLTREKLHAAIESIQNWEGSVFNSVTFGSNDHQGVDGISLAQVRNDTAVPITGFLEKGKPIDFSPVFFISLAEGLNMISLPLKPPKPFSARTLAEDIDATVVIKLDENSQRFVGFTLDAPDDGFQIEGGKGYIVNVKESRVVAFTGAAWTNQPPIQASPILAPSDGAWALVVSGKLEGSSTKDGYQVTVRNTRTNAIATDIVRSGYFAAAFADLARNNVVQIGDRLEVRVRDQAGEIVSEVIPYKVTTETIRQAFLPIALKGVGIPRQTVLLQNYPNPFNPETFLPYKLREPAEVVIRIYNAKGGLVRTLSLGHRKAGFYLSRSSAAYWDGHNYAGEKVASGAYFYQIQVGNFSATRKMAIVK